MIPQRIKLSGFLSYKDEQEIHFKGSQLWMLAGENGSGKSSIFDAVTYALFGHHRGGSQSAVELINKESNTFNIEFDFTVERQLYRIKRTVRRKPNGVTGTQQVLKLVRGSSLWSRGGSANGAVVHAEANGDAICSIGAATAQLVLDPEPANGVGFDLAGDSEDDWEAIHDTTYKAKFDAWVRDSIGLDYETFTSSVLLLQGKSEKLLDSTPSGRAGVLARIVDLERYQKLHARADEKRKELKGHRDEITNQLGAIRDVTDEELLELGLRIEGAQARGRETQERIDALGALEQQARRWDEARSRLEAARTKLANAETLLGHAVAIEKEFARMRELHDVLPVVGVIVAERGRILESERKTETLLAQRETGAERRRQCEHALDQARKKLTALKKTLTEDEVKAAALNTRLRELSGVLEKVKLVEDAAAEVARLEQELKPLATDADSLVRQLQQDGERLTLLSQHVAVLDRLHQDRSELVKVQAAEKKAKAREAQLLEDGKHAKEEFEAVQVSYKTAQEARGKAEEAAAEARALAKQARDLADEFKGLSGAKTCRACGQPLTPQHYASEKKKRAADAAGAEEKLKGLNEAAEAARAVETAAAEKEKAERGRLDKIRDQYKDAQAAVKQHILDLKRLTESCRQSYFALPSEFKEKIGPDEPDDWSAATYPDRAELTRLSQEVRGLEAVKRRLAQVQDEAKKVQTLRTRLETARESHARARQGLPKGDPAALRQESASKQSEETIVAASIKSAKREIDALDKDIERRQRDLGEIDRELTEITGKLNLEESTRKQSGEAVERARRSLPEAWKKPAEHAGMNEQLVWKEEYEKLVARQIESKFTQLQAARTGLDSLRAEIALQQEEVAAFPADVRRAPEDVKGEIAAARKELETRNKELLDAQRDRGILDEYRAQRQELNARYKTIDGDFNRYKSLTELLGRDRLQRFLVRKAEKQIVDYANAVLDRLSGSQLFLRLVGTDEGTTEKALDLECANRVAGGVPINVAFLSGSQRFRVAVALALGIGQYASKQHRPIESVIIDEGFGCLDRAGRQVMIQELQNLRGHLNCILLVSHQEEFADAFPDGYRFHLENGATKVTRYVK